jgi:8-oxo-dGTP diphosphatase
VIDMPQKDKIELTNMVMIEDKATGKVLVQERIKSWCGLTFPGGHVEEGESFVDSAVREVKEETGLDVKKLIPCGVVHWANKRGGETYLEFLYKTSDFYGIITESTVEGSVKWMTREELENSGRLSPNFEHYLPMFFENKYSELYFEWDGESWTAEPHYF